MTTTAHPDGPPNSRAAAAPAITGCYGEAPSVVTIDGRVKIDLSAQWTEFMHYAYLPVRLPASELTPDDLGGGVAPIRLPERLEFLRPLVKAAIRDAAHSVHHLDDPYVYVTARRGYATPGNPINRPGWHCDDWGGTDLNYIWSDRYGTRLLRAATALAVSDDDVESMRDMTAHAALAEALTLRWHSARQFNGNAPRPKVWLDHAEPNQLLRLTPYVIHDTPLIPEPGGMRSFLKISVSSHRYDLVGNSHNHLFDYDWPMRDRQALRNQPQLSNRDYSGNVR